MADTSGQQDVVSNVIHCHFGFNEMTGLAFENNGDVCVALIMRGAADPAAKQDGLLRGIAFGHALDKSACRFERVGGEPCGSHVAG
jgi:hypothetical protein